MTKINYFNRSSHASVHRYSFLEIHPFNAPGEAIDFHQKVAEEIAEMHRRELAGEGLQSSDDLDLHDDMMREPDDSQPLIVEPPLTLSKICSKLTAIEQLWLARLVKAHGKEVVLARWPAYEVHINYVRCLR